VGHVPTSAATTLEARRIAVNIAKLPGLLDKDASRSRILAALMAPGRTEGVRKIAKRLGVDPGTVQRISRPFGASVA
jgi:DNA-binding MarR family transcriptional regulator